MTNYSSKILNNAVSAINAQRAIIANTANNIANVDTEGYHRREVTLETRRSSGAADGLNLGSGVQATDVVRVNDEFLERVAREALSESKSYETQQDFIDRVEPLFSLQDGTGTIGSGLTQFFDSLENLSLNPGSVELRSDVLERAQDLVDSIGIAYNAVADLQAEAEERLSSEIESINTITTSIAELNGDISSLELSGSSAADERDRRAVLLSELSEKISFSMVEESNGAVTLSLANGFSLVNGVTSRDLELTNSPSFSATVPPKLDGSSMQYIVYDYDPATGSAAHLDLTQALREGDGIVGGLLAVRGYSASSATSAFEADGSLVEVAGRIESIARDLVTRFNERYLGPETTADPTVGVHDPSALDLNGNNPGVFGFFDLGTVTAVDDDADGLPEAADIDAMITAGTISNVASLLSLAISDPEDIAAARDETNGTALAEGNADNLIGTATQAGLIALKNETTTFNSNAAGTFSRAGVSYNELYNETVGRVGSLERRARSNYNISNDGYLSAQNKVEQLSGVSLDEEFSNLIRFQQNYQAAARLLNTAQQLNDEILRFV